jgi:hypothetical protein
MTLEVLRSPKTSSLDEERVMRIYKYISVVLVVLFGICFIPRFSEGEEQGSYIGEYCFDMVTTSTLLYYDLPDEMTGLLRLTVFSAPSGVYSLNGSLSVTGNSIVIPLVGTAVKDGESLRLSVTGPGGYESIQLAAQIRENSDAAITFFGLAHRYVTHPGLVGVPPPGDLKEIGHQPFSGTLTPRACP